MIPLAEPLLKGNELKYVQECIETGWVSSVGKFVDRFEDSVATFVGSKYAVAMSNGTAALHTALLVSGIKPGDEVIVPTLTFIAPINVVTYCGAYPVFMDCDKALNIDVDKVGQFLEQECVLKIDGTYRKKTGRRVHAIIPVHVFGNPVSIRPLARLAQEYRLKLIEDATESLGSYFSEKHTGTFGTAGCFSFNGNKIITTGGGGMLVTDDEKIAQQARHLSTQAKEDNLYYSHDQVGYNYRLTNIQAALGLAQMETLPAILEMKHVQYEYYLENLREIPGLRMITPPLGTRPNHWFHTIIIDPVVYKCTRDEILKKLISFEIQARPVWKLNHKQKPYQSAESFFIEKAPLLQAQAINLPCSSSLTEDQMKTVIDVLKKGSRL
ncbi:MAG: LegC family aminotransferase [Deltaproteobacteria bacterium]|nr:MAG: LegC family aminotransferase [Deltaproteobacteria bacterium]